jgi:hypothetical protein
VENGAGKKVVAFVIQNHEAFAALYVDGFFAMQMFAGVPAHGNLCSHQAAPAGGKTKLGGDHQGRFVILPGAHPFEILASRHPRRVVNLLVVCLGSLQPGTVKIAHNSSCSTQILKYGKRISGRDFFCQLHLRFAMAPPT